MKQHREDSHSLGKIQDLDNGRTGGEYEADYNGFLWYAPPSSVLHSLVPGTLAFVYITYSPPGVARTTELM